MSAEHGLEMVTPCWAQCRAQALPRRCRHVAKISSTLATANPPHPRPRLTQSLSHDSCARVVILSTKTLYGELLELLDFDTFCQYVSFKAGRLFTFVLCAVVATYIAVVLPTIPVSDASTEAWRFAKAMMILFLR